MNKIGAILILLLFACGGAFSQDMQKKEEKKQEQFIYVLKLVPRLLDEKNWTEQDGRIVGAHFRRLQQLLKDGKVILAGKTLNDSDPSQFGVVILKVDSEAEARKIMEEDDAVREKIMTAQLFAFHVALMQ